MLITGKEDMHVRRTIEAIKRSFEQMICEMDYEKITCAGSSSYQYIRSGMLKEVNDSGWGKSEKYNALSEFDKRALMNFINNAVLGIYRQWVEDGKQQSVEEIIALTIRLVLGGVDAFFK